MRAPLACAIIATLVACRGGRDASVPSTQQPPARAVDAGTSPDAPERAGRIDPFVPPALSEADCKAFLGAPALAVAVVVTSQADCSGIGHLRVVLEVRHRNDATDIDLVSTSRPLYAQSMPAYRLGDAFIVAIEPAAVPAETVYCVPLPARQGQVLHLVGVDDESAGERTIEGLLAGELCP